MKQATAQRLLLAGMIAVAMAFAALYCRAIGPYWKLTPDSTTYVGAAQSLAEGKGFKEGGYPAELFPPGTAALLAVGWIAGGGSYRVLNAEAALFALASLAVCFLLFRDSLGVVGSGVVVLLCLGSAEFFALSTFLLSEVFFVFFSLLALWWYQRGSTTGSALSALAAGMTRSVGVCVGAAFLLDSLRRRPRRWSQIAAYTAPILFAAAWEVRNRRLGWSYTELMAQNEPWDRASGHVTAGRFVSRMFGNFASGRTLEDLLTNGLTHYFHWAVWPGIFLGPVIAVGFWRLSLKGSSPDRKPAAGIYVLLFFTVLALYFVVVVRLFVPVLPLLFAYLVAGVQEVVERTTRKWLYAPAALLLCVYLVAGYRQDRAIAAYDQSSPFPGLTKYAGSEDMQSVALWLKAHTPESDIYGCQHPNVINIITGRDGVNYPAAGDAQALESGMRSQHIRFLLLDMSSGSDRSLDRIASTSGKFSLTRQEGPVRLYELPRQPIE